MTLKTGNPRVLASTKGDSGSCLNLTLRNQTTFFKILRDILCGFWTPGINVNIMQISGCIPYFPVWLKNTSAFNFKLFSAGKMYISCCSFHKIDVLQKTVIQMPQTSSSQILRTRVIRLFSKLCFYSIFCLQQPILDTILSHYFI